MMIKWNLITKCYNEAKHYLHDDKMKFYKFYNDKYFTNFLKDKFCNFYFITFFMQLTQKFLILLLSR